MDDKRINDGLTDLSGSNEAQGSDITAQASGKHPADAPSDPGRRRFNQGAALVGATVAAGVMAPSAVAKFRRVARGPAPWSGRSSVAVIGAGIAGLACANELQRMGLKAQVFEGSERIGGRIASLRGFFPGQVVERGAEFIGASHHVMLGYARSLGLALEDAGAFPGSDHFLFGGQRYSTADVQSEFRAFAASAREDFSAMERMDAAGATEHLQMLDFMSVEDFLTLHQAGGLLKAAVGAAYRAEFGAEPHEMSALTLQRFLYGDKRSQLAPFAAHASRDFRVVGGNDLITTGLASRLLSKPVLGHRLEAVSKRAGGRIRLSFNVGGRSVQTEHDAVVLALPASVLRDVHLDDSLQLPAEKKLAISQSAMGAHAKLMVGFNRPYWYIKHERNGSGHSDSAYLAATYESNPGKSSDTHAVLSSSLAGNAARTFANRPVQQHVATFLADLESALPGAGAEAMRNGRGQVLAQGEDWAANAWSRGSVSIARPGYFTHIALHQASAVGNLLFAGEHTSSFHEWQGFMEGGALSGLRAASEVFSMARARAA